MKATLNTQVMEQQEGTQKDTDEFKMPNKYRRMLITPEDTDLPCLVVEVVNETRTVIHREIRDMEYADSLSVFKKFMVRNRIFEKNFMETTSIKDAICIVNELNSSK